MISGKPTLSRKALKSFCAASLPFRSPPAKPTGVALRLQQTNHVSGEKFISYEAMATR